MGFQVLQLKKKKKKKKKKKTNNTKKQKKVNAPVLDTNHIQTKFLPHGNLSSVVAKIRLNHAF